MIDKDLQDEILNLISSSGAVDSNTHINGHLDHVVSMSSGSPRIQTNVLNKFSVILSQPSALKTISPLGLRCALCKRVISYPAWYYSVKYAVNQFHYFICFVSSSPNKPSTECYRK